MEKWLKLVVLSLAVAIVPRTASAHERQVFRIGDRAYIFVVGFLNEPVFAGDKSGLGLRIQLADPRAPLTFASPNVKPAEKLETSLKVEVSSGTRKKVFALEPAFRDPGSYRAHFYPTAAATYSFRVFGEMNATPVELTFTCAAAEHTPAREDRSEVNVADRVTRIFRTGAFACPQAKETAEFP